MRFLKQFAVFCAVAVLAATPLSMAQARTLARPGQRYVVVVGVQGDAKIGKSPVAVGHALEAGEILKVGDAPDSLVDLKFPEGHQVRLKAGTIFNLEAGPAKTRLVRLMRGRAFVHFQKGPDAKDFKVITRTAVSGVRGTKFVTEVDAVKGTYICVCEGVVEVQKPDGGAKQLVKKGQDLWSYDAKALAPAVDSPNMSQMTEDEFAKMTF